jgi:hypothetical protein
VLVRYKEKGNDTNYVIACCSCWAANACTLIPSSLRIMRIKISSVSVWHSNALLFVLVVVYLRWLCEAVSCATGSIQVCTELRQSTAVATGLKKLRATTTTRAPGPLKQRTAQTAHIHAPVHAYKPAVRQGVASDAVLLHRYLIWCSITSRQPACLQVHSPFAVFMTV